jgi:hypothetical protein
VTTAAGKKFEVGSKIFKNKYDGVILSKLHATTRISKSLILKHPTYIFLSGIILTSYLLKKKARFSRNNLLFAPGLSAPILKLCSETTVMTDD